MLWGGLTPIRHRFLLDVSTLASLSYSAFIAPSDDGGLHISILLLSCLVTYVTAGLTKRWTVSLPMAGIVFVQCLRPFISASSRWQITIRIVSLLLVTISFALTILFPAVDIRRIEGKYNVGVVDVQLPVEGFANDHVSIRLLYPTLEKSERIPYFNRDTSDQMTEAFVKVAPSPFNKVLFMLKHWQFCTIDGKRNAVPFVPEDELSGGDHVHVNSNGEEEEATTNDNHTRSGLPIIVFSHGITGNVHVYSYQTMSMAANGSFVMSINHSDGSSIGYQRQDGSFHEYDKTTGEIGSQKGRLVESVLLRRKQADYRCKEYIAATEALMKLNDANLADLDELGVSFVGKLNVNRCIASGHSFGAISALESANERTDLYRACIAHDPALDWGTDELRNVLLHNDRFEGSRHTYNGGTGGFKTEDYTSQPAKTPSVHDLDLFFLYSNQFSKHGWGEYNLIKDLFKRGHLGRPNGCSDLGFVYNAHHSEFSDSCMKVPLWLARATGLTGSRNPHETAEEIMTRTASFIENVRSDPTQKRKVA